MSKYYSGKRTRNVYDPSVHGPGKEEFKLSRSKIDLFLECPRCFYLDIRLGVKRPPGYPFTLNSAVDDLFKTEFDVHREAGTPHPIMERDGIDAVPFQHKKMDEWRNTFKGVRTLHEPTNLLIFGAVDDVWVDPDGNLIVVDYKATSKSGEIGIDADWQESYKRQMEIYQWLLRQNGFDVAPVGYIVYANGRRDVDAFDNKLEFDITTHPYEGSDDWIEPTLQKILELLQSGEYPKHDKECDYCIYRGAVKGVIEESIAD